MRNRLYFKSLFYFILLVFSISLIFGLDTDLDGINDSWEITLGFNPLFNDSDSNLTAFNESLNGIIDSLEDLDSDLLLNKYEISNFTDPLNNDTDFDGKSDFFEITNNLNPNVKLEGFSSKNSITIGENLCYDFNISIYYNRFNSTLSNIFDSNLIYLNSTNNGSFIPIINSNNISFNFTEGSIYNKYNFLVCSYLNDSLITSGDLIDYSIISYFNSNSYESLNLSKINVVEPNISLSFSSNITNIKINESILFEIILNNSGSTAYNVSLKNILSDGLIYSNSSETPIFNLNNTYSFFLGNISSIYYLNITALVNYSYKNLSSILVFDSLSNNLSYNAYSYFNYSSARKYSDNSNLEILIKGANFSVSQDKNNVSIGDEIIYNFIFNFSNAGANNIIFNSSFLNGLEIINYSVNKNQTFSNLGNNLIWNFGNLTYPEIFEMNLTLRVNSSLKDLDLVTNHFNLSYESSNSNIFIEENFLNILIVEPNLIFDYYSKPLTKIGDNLTYFVNITNNGNSIAYNTTFIFNIDDGLEFLESNIPTNNISGLFNETLTYNLGNLNVNSNTELEISFNISEFYRNSNYILAEDYFISQMNISYFSFTNNSKFYFNQTNLDLVKIISPEFLIKQNLFNGSIGDFYSFNLLFNFSEVNSNNVSFIYDIPYGLEFINYSSNISLNFSNLGNRLFFNLGNISNRNLYSIDIYGKINSSLFKGDNLANNFSLKYSSSDLSNFYLNYSNSILIVEPQLNISISAFSPVSISDILTYIINITNNGNSIAYLPKFFYKLANGTDFILSSPNYNNISGNNNTLEFILPNIFINSSYQINVSVNITNSYDDNSLILANDTLTSFSNISFYSVLNTSLSRNYSNYKNSTVLVKDGAILKNTTGSIMINSNPAVRIGENFLYSIIVNFTGAPANSVLVSDLLPNNFNFISQNNSYNNSAFINTSNLLKWNFGNLNGSVKIIYINFTVKALDWISSSFGTGVSNLANLTYANSIGSSILKQDSAMIYFVEPNIKIENILLDFNENPQINNGLIFNDLNNFEVDFDGWIQSTSDDYDWRRNSGTTPSSNTGPSSANEGSYYIYTESSLPVTNGDIFIIEKTINITNSYEAYISFDYNMYFAGASDGGVLEFYIFNGTDNLEWIRSGDQGNLWHDNEIINFSSYLGQEITLKFKFTTGTNQYYQNDCSLDDIKIIKKEIVPLLFNVGDNINYILNISNLPRSNSNYTSEIYNITLINKIPNGFLYNYSSIIPDSINLTHLIWKLGNLSVGEEIRINLTLKSNNTYQNNNLILSGDSFNNNISLTGHSFNEENFARTYFLYDNSIKSIVNSPNIKIYQDRFNGTIGDIINYYTLINFSSSPVLDFYLNSSFNFGFEFLNYSSNYSSLNFNKINNNLIFNFGNITNRTIYSINFSLRINSSVEFPDILENNFNFNFKNSSFLDLNIFNSTSIEVLEPSLYIEKSNLYDVASGEIINYTLNITNVGTSIAFYPTFNEFIGDGLLYLNSTTIPLNISGNNLTFILDNLTINELKQINFTVLVLENYSNGDKILSNDIIINNFNLSYYSFKNLSLAKYYTNYTNSSIVLYSPLLNINVSSSFENFNISGVKIGEVFNLSLILDFNNRPVNEPILTDYLPSNFGLLGQNNSYNNSIFNNSLNYLTWNFSKIDFNLTPIISINLFVYLKNLPINNIGNKINNNFNLSYKNSDNISIIKNISSNIYILEPNLNISIISNQTFIEFYDKVIYTINISNLQTLLNTSSTAYDLFLTNYLPDGVNFISSTLPRIDENKRNLTYDLNNLIVNEINLINITVVVNDTLINGSFNNLSFMKDIVNINFNSGGIDPRDYNLTNNVSIVLYDITPPILSNPYINFHEVTVLENLSFNVDAFDEVSVDTCLVEITYPNSSKYNFSDSCVGYEFNVPNLVGIYNITFYANDSSGNWGSLDGDSFEAGPQIIFNTTIVNDNLSGLNVSVKIFYNNTLIKSDNSTIGNLSEIVSIFNYDILFETYLNSFKVKLNGVNISDNLNETIGFDKIINFDSDKLVIYGVLNDNYNFTNASVNISYNDLSYSNENNLELLVCEDWNFTNRNCSSTWNPLNGIQDTENNYFSFLRTKFSAFAIFENIPTSSSSDSSTSTSSSGGGIIITKYEDSVIINNCISDWSCSIWSDCFSGFAKRDCFDKNNCSDLSSQPDLTKKCKTTTNNINESINQTLNKEIISEKKESIFNNPVVKKIVIPTFYIFLYILSIILILGIRYKVIRDSKMKFVRIKGHTINYYKDKGNFDYGNFSFRFYLILFIIGLMPVGIFYFGLTKSFIIGFILELILLGYLYNRSKELKE